MKLARSFHRCSQRAVALATAMVVCLLMLMLTGALIQTQSGAFAVAQSSDARVRARAACQSVYDYCLYQIEHDRTWGAAGFPTLESVDPSRRDPGGTVSLPSRVEIRKVTGTNKFEGYLSELETSFEVEVVNGLTSPGTTGHGALSTPPEHVRFSIAAWEGNGRPGSRSRQQVDCLLRLAPLFDASVLSRGTIDMQANQVIFSSKDPFRNEIRGEGMVTMPGLTDGSTLFVKHDAEVTHKNSNVSLMKKDQTGLLWAGGKIQQNGVPLDANEMAQAARASGGRLVENATSRADIYDLKPENIPQPKFEKDHDIVVPPGEFRFTIAMANVRYQPWLTDELGVGYWGPEQTRQEPVDVMEYYDPPGSTRPKKVMRSETRPVGANDKVIGTDITYSGDMSDVPVVTGNRFAVDDSFRDSEMIKDSDGVDTPVAENGFRNLRNGETSPVVIDLSERSVTVQPETRVRPRSRSNASDTPSAFELTVKKGPGGDPGLPRFNLGNGRNDVVIEADGDISIGTGYTDGLATFISKKGSVSLNPVAQKLQWKEVYVNGIKMWALENEVEVEDNPSYSGLVIYAEKDVNISNISNADWGVRGFIYARHDFNFDVNGKNATFYGSVVAGNNPADRGSFRINNSDRSTFIYDPDYLKLLTKSLPYNWSRVEPLLWTEANG